MLIEVVLQLDPGEDADDEERAELTQRLRADLDDLELDSVRVGRQDDPPMGAKSGEAFAWGALVVGVVSSGALTALINAVNAWIGRQRSGSVSVKIDGDELVLTGASSEDQCRVIDDWLARRADRAAQDDG